MFGSTLEYFAMKLIKNVIKLMNTEAVRLAQYHGKLIRSASKVHVTRHCTTRELLNSIRSQQNTRSLGWNSISHSQVPTRTRVMVTSVRLSRDRYAQRHKTVAPTLFP